MTSRREDSFATALIGVSLAVAFALIGVNAAFFRYTGIAYFSSVFWPLVALLFPVAAVGLRLRESRPDWSFLLVAMSFYGAAMVVEAAFATGIQYTPFPPIDAALARWDAALGFNVTSAMAWTQAHPRCRSWLWRSYDSLQYQLLLVPLLACCLRDRARMKRFTYAFVYSFFAGDLFYYFFPSSGPAGVYVSPYFDPVQRLTHVKFYNVHHFLAVTTRAGGLIAFPSFHVVWGVLLTCLARGRSWAFLPLLALNALMIASTLLLGWHFLVDVVSGVVLALVTLRLGDWTCRRLEAGAPLPDAPAPLPAAAGARAG